MNYCIYYYEVGCSSARPWTPGREFVFLPYVRVTNWLFRIFRSLASSFRAPHIFFMFLNHQGAAFLFFLPLSLPSSIAQWSHEEGIFFLRYVQNFLFEHIVYEYDTED